MHTPFIELTAATLSNASAGFWGSIVHLSLTERTSKIQLLLRTITSTVSAIYITPVITWVYDAPIDIHVGFAFVIGIIAVGVVKSVFLLFELFKQALVDIASVIRKDPSELIATVIRKVIGK